METNISPPKELARRWGVHPEQKTKRESLKIALQELCSLDPGRVPAPRAEAGHKPARALPQTPGEVS